MQPADRNGAPTPGVVAPYAARLFEAVAQRHARRSYDGTRISSDDLEGMEAFAHAFQPWPGVRAEVVRDAPQSIFAGIVGAYGGISGAPSALVFIGGTDTGPEAVGYVGEAVVLEATARGLDTCWVAGTFSKRATAGVVRLAPGERVFAVSPVGHACVHTSTRERVLFGAARAKRRRALDEIAPGYEEWPVWARAAVKTAQVAPSALNRQPWRFRIEDGALVMSFAGADAVKGRASKRLDVGIAMLHAELGALAEGVTGHWELLAERDVARYVPR